MGLVGARECAAELGVHLETVRRLHRAGKIPSYRVGSNLRFDVQEVKAALRGRPITANKEAD